MLLRLGPGAQEFQSVFHVLRRQGVADLQQGSHFLAKGSCLLVSNNNAGVVAAGSNAL